MKNVSMILCCAILLLVGSLAAQVSEEWTRRYAGPGNY